MSETSPTLSKLKQELLPAMGAALMKLQFFELYVSGCLLALSPAKDYTTDDLLSGDATRRAPTLGVLIAGLRRLMPLDPRFDDRLRVFIENRNYFIHRFFVPDIARGGPDSEDHIYRKLSFILALMRETDALDPIFRGLYSLLHRAQFSTSDIDVDPDIEGYAADMQSYEKHFIAVLQSTNGT